MTKLDELCERALPTLLVLAVICTGVSGVYGSTTAWHLCVHGWSEADSVDPLKMFDNGAWIPAIVGGLLAIAYAAFFAVRIRTALSEDKTHAPQER